MTTRHEEPVLNPPQNEPAALQQQDKLINTFGYLILVIAVSLSAFQIWQGITSTISATYFRPVHLCWVLVLIFLHYPLIKTRQSVLYIPGRLFDLALCAVTVYAGYRMSIFDYNDIDHLLYGLGSKISWQAARCWPCCLKDVDALLAG